MQPRHQHGRRQELASQLNALRRLERRRQRRRRRPTAPRCRAVAWLISAPGCDRCTGVAQPCHTIPPGAKPADALVAGNRHARPALYVTGGHRPWTPCTPTARKRDFKKTAEPAKARTATPGTHTLRRPEARRHPPALRPPARARRRAEVLGRHPRPQPGPQGEAPRRRGRGPPASTTRPSRAPSPRAATAAAPSSSGTREPGSR